MTVNRGKQFEDVIRKSFERVDGVSIDRLNDNTAGFKGVSGICDFIVYKEPYEYYFECKSVHGASLPFSNITETQWTGLLEKSKIEGVFAGVICWWVDKDITRFIPIQILQMLKEEGRKSLNCYWDSCVDVYNTRYYIPEIKGKKKRVFFDYSMEEFLSEIQFNR